MEDSMECMCLQCGVSAYLQAAQIAVEDIAEAQLKLIRNNWCPECGGPLTLVGRAGEEPFYRLK